MLTWTNFFVSYVKGGTRLNISQKSSSVKKWDKRRNGRSSPPPFVGLKWHGKWLSNICHKIAKVWTIPLLYICALWRSKISVHFNFTVFSHITLAEDDCVQIKISVWSLNKGRFNLGFKPLYIFLNTRASGLKKGSGKYIKYSKKFFSLWNHLVLPSLVMLF